MSQYGVPFKKRAMAKTAHIREAGETGVNPAWPRWIHAGGASNQRSNGARGRDHQTFGKGVRSGEPWLGGIRGKPEGSSVEHGRPIVWLEWGKDKGHELWRWQATLSRASIKLVPLGRTGNSRIRGMGFKDFP